MVEHRAVDGLRAAVNVKHSRIGLLGVKVLGPQHPAADLRAAAGDLERLRLRHIAVGQRGGVEIGHPRDFARAQIRAVELLQSHVVERDEQHLVAAGVKGVDAAAFGDHRRIAAVRVQTVEQAVSFAGGEVVERAAVFRCLPAAAETAVAADRVVHVILLLAQHGQLTACGINTVDPGVFVQAEAPALRGEQPQLASDALHPFEHQFIAVEHCAPRAAAPVHRVQGKTLECQLCLPRRGSVNHLVAQDRHALHVVRQLGHGPDLQRVDRHEEQPRALAVGHARAVEPERQLVKHLVIFILLRFLAHICAHLFVGGIEVGMLLVHRSGDGKVPLVQHVQLIDCKGQREGVQRLAAAQVEHIVGREGLLRLRTLFLLRRAHRREQQPLLIQPDEAALLAHIGQLAHCAVFVQPEPPLVTVVLLVGVGHHEGRPLSAGCITHV